MESHIKAVGLLHVVLGSLGLLGGLTALAVFGGLAGMVRYSDTSPDAAVAIPILGGIGVIVFIVIIAFSVPGLRPNCWPPPWSPRIWDVRRSQRPIRWPCASRRTSPRSEVCCLQRCVQIMNSHI